MLLSELIEIMENAKKEHGDIVVYIDDWYAEIDRPHESRTTRIEGGTFVIGIK